MAARVGIIMRSKNSAWVIDQALAALYAQHFQDFDLLVVDSGSTDATLSMVNAYPCRVERIAASDYYPGAVLNSAIGMLTHELIVFVNSDAVLLSPHSLARLVDALDQPDVAAAFGRQIPRPEADGWVRRDYAVSFPDSGDAPAWMTLSLPLAGIRRSVWVRHPFYTDAWGSEDTEWGYWARREGLRVVYVHDALVMHSHNYTLRQLYGRRFIEGEADAFIYGGTDSLPSVVRRYLASWIRDAWWSVRTGDLRDVAAAPIRRLVYHYAYHKGRRWGEHRRQTGNTDTSAGQQVVLTRYDR